MTELRLLGPFECPASVPGGKPRALLARLALDAGRFVSSSTLVEALWESPPPSAQKVLQAHVSALRKALGRDAIETRAAGYALRGAPTDLARFEELAGRAARCADVPERARLLREALEMWRGEALAEFRREPFAASASARLEELRLDAHLARVEVDLELGLAEELVHELTGIVAAEPLREAPRRLLMLALYRAGRQAEALAAYRDYRGELVETLGIEPTPLLQELERAILRQDARLAPAARWPARGTIVCIGTAALPLLAPLDRDLVVVELLADAAELPSARSRLASVAHARTAAFTSDEPVADMLRLAVEHRAELLVAGAVSDELLAAAPCDVAVVNDHAHLGDGPVVAPFGGRRDEWPALELAAWLAAAHGRPLRLLGVEAAGGRRDASRTLAAASLALQRFARAAIETAVVPAGAAGILGAGGAAVVAALRAGAVRDALLGEATVPVLLVHGGLRPGGLAPEQSLTRFSWSLADPDR